MKKLSSKILGTSQFHLIPPVSDPDYYLYLRNGVAGVLEAIYVPEEARTFILRPVDLCQIEKRVPSDYLSIVEVRRRFLSVFTDEFLSYAEGIMGEDFYSQSVVFELEFINEYSKSFESYFINFPWLFEPSAVEHSPAYWKNIPALSAFYGYGILAYIILFLMFSKVYDKLESKDTLSAFRSKDTSTLIYDKPDESEQEEERIHVVQSDGGLVGLEGAIISESVTRRIHDQLMSRLNTRRAQLYMQELVNTPVQPNQSDD